MFVIWLLIFGIIFSMQIHLNNSIVKLHHELFDTIFYLVVCVNFLLFAVSSTILFGFAGIVVGALFVIFFHISVGWLIILPLYRYSFSYEYSVKSEPLYWIYVYIAVMLISILFTVYVCITKQWKAGLNFYNTLTTELKIALLIVGFVLSLIRSAYSKKLRELRTEASITWNK